MDEHDPNGPRIEGWRGNRSRASRPAFASDSVAAASVPAVNDTASTPGPSEFTSSLLYKKPGKRRTKRTKKLNNFNIFFMLERQLLLHSRGHGLNTIENPIDTSDSPLVRQKELRLPPLCRRYSHLPLTSNWFLELLVHQNKKRPHRKKHGLIPFKELTHKIATNYRDIDEETQSFVNEVANRLGCYCAEIKAIEEHEKKQSEEERRKRDVAPQSSRDLAPLRHVAGNERKDPPLLLSQDKAATAQRLMDMKATPSTSFAEARHGALLSPPLRGVPVDSRLPYHPPPLADLESERLKAELARAMSGRAHSERMIQLLQEQMTRHCARTAAAAASVRDQSRYLAMLAGGSPPQSRHHHPDAPPPPAAAPRVQLEAQSKCMAPTSSSPGCAKYEKELLKEALLRRMISPRAKAASASAAGPLPPSSHFPPVGSLAEDTLLPDLEWENRDEATLKKRVRYSQEGEVKDLPPKKFKTGDGGEENFQKGPSEDTTRAPTTSAHDIGSYKDLFYKAMYTRLVQNRRKPPPRASPGRRPGPIAVVAATLGPDPFVAAAAARDLAFFDGIATHGLSSSGGTLGGESQKDPWEEVMRHTRLATELARLPPPIPRPAREPHPSNPGPHQSSRGNPHGGLYAAPLVHFAPLVRLTSPPPTSNSATPPPLVPSETRDLLDIIHTTSHTSQLGLSYNELMDIWKDMNQDQTTSCDKGEGSNGRGKAEVEG